MAAAKKKTVVVPPLFKRWETEDESLVFRLDVPKPGHEFELSVEDMDAKKQTIIELAVDIPQIDEMLAVLTKAKDTLQRYNRGEAIESDIEEEEEDEEESGITISGLEDEDESEDDGEEDETDDLDDEDEDDDLEEEEEGEDE